MIIAKLPSHHIIALGLFNVRLWMQGSDGEAAQGPHGSDGEGGGAPKTRRQTRQTRDDDERGGEAQLKERRRGLRKGRSDSEEVRWDVM